MSTLTGEAHANWDDFQKAYDESNYSLAFKHANMMIKLNPNRYEAYEFRGKALREDAYPLDSIKDFTKAIELCRSDKWKAKLYAHRGYSLLQAKQTEQAILDSNKSIEMKPDCNMAHSNLVEIHEDAGQYNRAIETCNQALARKVFNPIWFYESRARLYSKLKDRRNAFSDIEKAISLDPKNVGLKYTKARISIEFKDYPSAIEGLRTVTNLNPKQGRYPATLAAILALSGQDAEALRVLAKTLKVINNSAAAHNNLGVLLMKQGKREEAKKHFEKAVRLCRARKWRDTREKELYIKNHARASVMTGDIGSVVDDYVGLDEAVTPSDTRSEEDFRKVIKRFDKLIALNPSDADNYFNRGMLYFAQGNFVSADRDLNAYLNKAKKKGSAWIFPWALRSICLRRLHKNDAAQQLLTTTDLSNYDYWTSTFKRFLLGEASQEELLRFSKSKKRIETSRCFIGLKLLADGKPADAKEQLIWLKKNCNPNYDEYLLATSALAQLEPPTQKKRESADQQKSKQNSFEKLGTEFYIK